MRALEIILDCPRQIQKCTIGRRMGTGGSSGVDYLDMTLNYRIFTDLWAVRTMLVKRDAISNPLNSEFYGYASDN